MPPVQQLFSFAISSYDFVLHFRWPVFAWGIPLSRKVSSCLAYPKKWGPAFLVVVLRLSHAEVWKIKYSVIVPIYFPSEKSTSRPKQHWPCFVSKLIFWLKPWKVLCLLAIYLYWYCILTFSFYAFLSTKCLLASVHYSIHCLSSKSFDAVFCFLISHVQKMPSLNGVQSQCQCQSSFPRRWIGWRPSPIL